MTIDFNSGRMACLKFKIRNKHSGETKQIKAWEFLKSKGAKTDGRSWTMDYNETILKKY